MIVALTEPSCGALIRECSGARGGDWQPADRFGSEFVVAAVVIDGSCDVVQVHTRPRRWRLGSIPRNDE